jgi:hypothetical protein
MFSVMTRSYKSALLMSKVTQNTTFDFSVQVGQLFVRFVGFTSLHVLLQELEIPVLDLIALVQKPPSFVLAT